jgi:hypothetical protein
MDLIVARSHDLLESMGPLAFGFYTSGELCLEDLGVNEPAPAGDHHSGRGERRRRRGTCTSRSVRI